MPKNSPDNVVSISPVLDHTKAELSKLLKQDLARSGLRSNLSSLGLQPTTRTQLAKQLGKDTAQVPVGGYAIPYFDIDGSPKTSNMGTRTFIRYRLFVENLPPQKKGFKTATPSKYTQPFNSGCHAYLCPLVNWKNVAKTPSIPIIITEGEKKAMAGCQKIKRAATLGLGGVWNFKNKFDNNNLLEELEKINWRDREVYICYDNDIVSKEEVRAAMDTLTKALVDRGAQVHTIVLPTPLEDGELLKIGLDDYLLHHGKEEDLFKLVTPLDERQKQLRALNGELAFIEEVGTYIKTTKMIPIKSHTSLISNYYSNRTGILPDGKKVNFAKEWNEWPNRRVHNNLVYAPGEPQVTRGNDLNLWRGWGAESVENPEAVKPLMKLLRTMFTEEDLKFLLQWLAYPVINPGARLSQVVLVWGQDTGTGKGTVGNIMRDIYGHSNTKEVGTRQIMGDSDYNGWLSGCTFIVGNEISPSNRSKRAASDAFKSLVTQETIEVNKKYQAEYNIRNTVNWYLTSNHEDAMYIDSKKERRIAVLEVQAKAPKYVFTAIDKGRATGELPAAFRYYLENEVSLKGYDPHAPAPETESKKAMYDSGLSGVEQSIQELINDESKLPTKDRDMFTTQEICATAFPNQEAHHIVSAVGNAVGKVTNGKKVRIYSAKLRKQIVVRPMRNLEKWEKLYKNKGLAVYKEEARKDYENSVWHETQIRPIGKE